MPDTRDERGGGDERAMLTAIRRRALMASTYAEWHQVGRDIETLGQLLANTTARAKKAEAALAHTTSVVDAFHAEADRMSDRYDNLRDDYDRLRARMAELGEPETEHRIIGVSGLAHTPTEHDLEHRADWLSGARLEERQVYPTPWRPADLTQQPEDAARAKFAADMDRLRKSDPAGAQWVEHILAERTAQQPEDDTTEAAR